MTEKEIDDLATKMAAHLPCTVAAIAGAIRKSIAWSTLDAELTASHEAAKMSVEIKAKK